MNRFCRALMAAVVVAAIISAFPIRTASQDPREPQKDRGAAAIARDDLRDAIIRAWLDAWPECVKDVERKIEGQPRCRAYLQKIEQTPTDFFIPPATAKKLTAEEIWWLKHNLGEAAKVGYHYGVERGNRGR
jgi:hypothetical protein